MCVLHVREEGTFRNSCRRKVGTCEETGLWGQWEKGDSVFPHTNRLCGPETLFPGLGTLGGNPLSPVHFQPGHMLLSGCHCRQVPHLPTGAKTAGAIRRPLYPLSQPLQGPRARRSDFFLCLQKLQTSSLQTCWARKGKDPPLRP